jgi:ABC-type multidrug transport system permease subunit
MSDNIFERDDMGYRPRLYVVLGLTSLCGALGAVGGIWMNMISSACGGLIYLISLFLCVMLLSFFWYDMAFKKKSKELV